MNPRMEELVLTESMGETAENVAERYGIARDDQDEFALESHRRAVAAAEAGRFDEEIVPVPVPAAEGRPGHRPRRRGTARRTPRSSSSRACGRSSARAGP